MMPGNFRKPKPPPTATVELGRIHDLEAKVAALEAKLGAEAARFDALLKVLDDTFKKANEAAVTDFKTVQDNLNRLFENDRKLATAIDTHMHPVMPLAVAAALARF